MFKKRLGKKGDWEIWLIILQPIIILAFLAFFGFVVNSNNKDNTLEQQYYARDLALTINAVMAAPTNFYLDYSGVRFADFDYKLNEGVLTVGSFNYYYADDLFLGKLKNVLIQKPRGLALENSLNFTAAEFAQGRKGVKYGYLQTRNSSWHYKNIVIEGESPLKDLLLAKGQPYLPESAEPDIVLKLEETEGKDIIVYLDFFTAEKSRKLASIMINYLAVRNPEVGKIRIYFTEEIEAKEAGVILQKGKELDMGLADLENSFEDYYG